MSAVLPVIAAEHRVEVVIVSGSQFYLQHLGSTSEVFVGIGHGLQVPNWLKEFVPRNGRSDFQHLCLVDQLAGGVIRVIVNYRFGVMHPKVRQSELLVAAD